MFAVRGVPIFLMVLQNCQRLSVHPACCPKCEQQGSRERAPNKGGSSFKRISRHLRGRAQRRPLSYLPSFYSLYHLILPFLYAWRLQNGMTCLSSTRQCLPALYHEWCPPLTIMLSSLSTAVNLPMVIRLTRFPYKNSTHH